MIGCFVVEGRCIHTDSLYHYIIENTPTRIIERYAGLRQAAATKDFGILDEDIVVIDTETTGLSFKHDKLTQIAAARMSHGEITDWFVTFVNPGKPIPEDIAHLTNIHDEDVAEAPTPTVALQELVTFVGKSNLVAHNAYFDKRFCTKIAAGAPLKERIWIDSLDLARIALPRLKSHRLLDLVRAFDAPLPIHRADADVEATCAIYRILLAAVDAMPEELVAEIAEMAESETWPTVFVFKQFASFGVGPFDLHQARQNNIAISARTPRVDADVLAKDSYRGISFAGTRDIQEAFSSDGVVGRIYPRFEARDEQVAMAQAVNKAFSSSVNLAVEAGTGVGKSMAYLVPAVFTAKRNGIGVGIATKTNALLDQLINHELPALSSAFGGIEYCSLKGFSHYPCLRMVERLQHETLGTKRVTEGEISRAPAFAALLSFIEQVEYDDIDALKIDYRALPRYEITTTSRDCLRRKCPYYGTKCFIHGLRQRAECVDIVVTNQTLLFCDLITEGSLLPPIRYWVVDEAHGAEAEARRAFSSKLDAGEIERIIKKIASESNRNLFIWAEHTLVGEVAIAESELHEYLTETEIENINPSMSAGDALVYALCAKGVSAGDAYATAARGFVEHIHDLLFFENNKRSKGYDTIELWINDDIRSTYSFKNLADLGQTVCNTAERLIRACQSLITLMEGVQGTASIQCELAGISIRLKDQISACELILFDAPETFVYSAHLIRNTGGRFKGYEALEACLLNVGDHMNETLYARTHSVVFTSATMTVADSFTTFTQALGLGKGEQSCVQTAYLESSYDFDTNMTVYVANDIPEPNDSRYLEVLERFLVAIHRAQEGSTLTLFTNRREMEKSHEAVQAALRPDRLRVVCQKWGVSVKGLRDEFIADEHLSLFALKSFWEGFDAPGATLKTVVLPKLPFNKPTDPLSQARQKVDPQAWSHFVLPEAVLETKQAAGRLIRSSTDTGNLILADRRLITKNYGKVFLQSLPSRNIHELPMAKIVEELQR